MKKFRENIVFPDIKAPEEIVLLLSMTREEMKNKDKEELSIDTARISQYALHLKIQTNKLEAILSWCDSNINSILGKELPNFQGWYQEKMLIVKASNQHIKELEVIRTSTQAQLNSIKDLDKKIEFYASTIKNLLFIKE